MTPVAKDATAGYRPCLVLAHRDPTYSRETARRFRRLGWDVYQAQGGAEARRLARMMAAELTVLDVDLADESGWLVCAKLRRELPGSQVVLVGDAGCPRSQQMAAFVGATALVRPCDEGLAGLLQASWSPPNAA
jgi:ActR/RegA family two-component response regulator